MRHSIAARCARPCSKTTIARCPLLRARGERLQAELSALLAADEGLKVHSVTLRIKSRASLAAEARASGPQLRLALVGDGPHRAPRDRLLRGRGRHDREAPRGSPAHRLRALDRQAPPRLGHVRLPIPPLRVPRRAARERRGAARCARAPRGGQLRGAGSHRARARLGGDRARPRLQIGRRGAGDGPAASSSPGGPARARRPGVRGHPR